MGSGEWAMVGFLLGITATNLWWWGQMKKENERLVKLIKYDTFPVKSIESRFENFEQWGKNGAIYAIFWLVFWVAFAVVIAKSQ